MPPDDWQGLGRLNSPKKSADNLDVDIILTGLHWGSSASGDGNIKLITTYRYHGIQCVPITWFARLLISMDQVMGH